MNKHTEFVLVVDGSSSMACWKEDTINTINSLIEIKRNSVQRTTFSLFLSNNGRTILHDRVDIHKIEPMTSIEYSVHTDTSLLDTMGRAIQYIKSAQESSCSENLPKCTFVVTITNGAENASQMVSRDALRKQIQQQKNEYGWKFLFLGANIGTAQRAIQLGIDLGCIKICSSSKRTIRGPRKNTRRGSRKYQLKILVDSMMSIGESKHEAKRANGGKPPKGKIYSFSTAGTYLNCGIRFYDWCYKHFGCKELSECRPYVEIYLLEAYIKKHYSAWTVWKNASALCKLLWISTDDLNIFLPDRRREDIHKNRNLNKTFDVEKWADLVHFCLSTGLRLCELKRLTTKDISQRSDGVVIVKVQRGKGGRSRHVIALDDFPLTLKRQAVADGQSKIFKKIPHNASIHYYRREFAQALYKREARPIETLSRSERYYCRGDMRGVILDRNAMQRVSYMLGHTRLGVTTVYLKGIILDYAL